MENNRCDRVNKMKLSAINVKENKRETTKREKTPKI